MNFVKNILIGVIVIVAILLGYYFISQNKADLLLDSDLAISDELISRTNAFIERRTILDAINLETDLYVDDRFTNLRTYSTAVPSQSVGRNNIFDAPLPVPTTRTVPIE